MKYLTTIQVLAIHDQALKRFGGSMGLRDLGLLESAVMRPKASFGGKDLYPSVFEKASSLFQSILKNHPFVDGNKRTALSSAGIFLAMNGYQLENSHKKEWSFVIKAENQNLSVDYIATWLKKRTEKYER